ncbi:MAG TPA: lysylphosphatidylglycerol synthase domain-containing protein [Steroidobacteraceae bacterium]|nr:lysylphosphatidylglycerol synthase domain-containing protein [Steroidobacteraceae bacterium]
MKLRIALIAAAGLAVAVYFLVYVGWESVLSAALTVGWGGFAILCVFGLGLFPLLGAAWHALLPTSAAGRFWVLIWSRMVRDAAGEVLPFSQLGGALLGARAALIHGVARPFVYASLIVDVTTEMLGQIAYVALGIVLLSQRATGSVLSPTLRAGITAGVLLLAAGGVAALLLQRRGHRLVTGLAARLLPRSVATAESVAAALDIIYDSPRRVALSAALHLAAWIVSAFGSWLALTLIGVQVHLSSVIAIESLVCVARSAAVMIPSALGVQEAAYAMLMPLFGVAPAFGLALSLLRRAREIAVGVPTLLVWQTVESRRVLAGPGL